MSYHTRLALAAALALFATSAAQPQTAATPAAPAPPPDPCAPSKYAGDTYFPKPAFPAQTRAMTLQPSTGFVVETVAEGLSHPRSLAFIGADRTLVSESHGRLRIMDKDGKLSAPIAGAPETLPDVAFDIALDRGFRTNRLLYLVYRAPRPGEVVPEGRRAIGIGRIVRVRLSENGDRLEDVKQIFEGGYLRRILAARDGTLLFTSTGAVGDIPQRLGEVDGKVMRINTDGSIPRDNPFVATTGARPELYSIGHRDPDGITLDPATGKVWLSEHGPRGGDEINVIQRGLNYGYPVITYGREYTGDLIDNGLTAKAGMQQPVYFWTPDIAPSGLVVYRGSMFPQWNGDLFVSSLVAKKLVRLQMRAGHVSGEEALLTDRCQRIRDVSQAPDGSLYVLTDEDSGAVLRIRRKP